jgi:hypothetical protein
VVDVLDVDVVFDVDAAGRFRPRERDWLELISYVRGLLGCGYYRKDWSVSMPPDAE